MTNGGDDRKGGFTLIELIVVVALIGLLAGIVFTSFEGTRRKANEGKIKSNLSSIRSSAETYYSRNNSFALDLTGGSLINNCMSGAASFLKDQRVQDLIDDIPRPAKGTVACRVGRIHYRIQAKFNDQDNTWYCVDDYGHAGVISQDDADTINSNPVLMYCKSIF